MGLRAADRLRRGVRTAAVGVALAGGLALPATAPTASAATAGRQIPAVVAAHPAFQRAGRAASERGVRKLIWGPVTLPNGHSAFPIYHRLGVKVLQIDLDWAHTARTRPADPTNPNDPAYRWPTELATAVAQARRYGIELCLLVHGSPRWANGGRDETWAPDKASDFGQFLTAAAHHYPGVHLWMIWGEPNRPGSFHPMPPGSPVGPRRYALVLNAGYHALKGVSRSNIVIGGDTWSFGIVEPAKFLRWMRLPDGKPPPLDYYGHNPFSRRFPDLSQNPYFPGGRDINDIDTLEAQLRNTYHRRVDLWLSEFTVSSNHANRAFAFSVSRKQQAKWLTAAYGLAGSVPYVAGLGWFNLLDQAPPSPQSLTSGLLTWNLKPKPAYWAYMRAS